MKIFSAAQIREWDQHTIQHEPVASIDLMERAATAFVNRFCALYPSDISVMIFCGPGNNGGDGLAAARLLLQKNYRVSTFVLRFTDKFSEDFQVNHERLFHLAPDSVFYLTNAAQLPSLKGHIIIDAIFGNGLSRPAEGLPAEIIGRINTSGAEIISIDLPSGLYTDKANAAKDTIIQASRTLSFQAPKLSFFFCSNECYTGRWEALDIGLDKAFANKQETQYHYLDRTIVTSRLKTRERCSHKGTYGHALIWAGSYGKIGAVLLCSRACLRAGAGLLTTYIPKCGYNIIQTAIPEAMALTDKHEDHLTSLPDLENYSAIGIGPGIGKEKDTANALRKLLKTCRVPLVIDADALNILAENKEWLKLLPENCILTPHPKEFERLAGASKDEWEELQKAREFAKQHNCILILKGAYTRINLPNGITYFNATGNPGMATGGSGDVLTGILCGLSAQRYSAEDAALLGVYLHGVAGDLAAQAKSQEGMIAGDIVEYLPKAFLEVRQFGVELL